MAKARMEVAHEVRLAKESEAAMDLHVHKAAEKVARHEEKYSPHTTDQQYGGGATDNTCRHNSGNLDYSNNQAIGGGVQDLSDSSKSHNVPGTTTGTGHVGAPPADKYI